MIRVALLHRFLDRENISDLDTESLSKLFFLLKFLFCRLRSMSIGANVAQVVHWDREVPCTS